MAFTDRLAATEGTLRARALLHGTQAYVSQREGIEAPLATVEAAGFKLAASAVRVLRKVVERPSVAEPAIFTGESFPGMQYVDLPPASVEPIEAIQEHLAFQYDNGTEI
ncbi:MAG: hypothetical protein QG553_460 [Patescibacteria group bacterium]|nr:hypothetical protein [Patescibacteria group bacterium]